MFGRPLFPTYSSFPSSDPGMNSNELNLLFLFLPSPPPSYMPRNKRGGERKRRRRRKTEVFCLLSFPQKNLSKMSAAGFFFRRAISIQRHVGRKHTSPPQNDYGKTAATQMGWEGTGKKTFISLLSLPTTATTVTAKFHRNGLSSSSFRLGKTKFGALLLRVPRMPKHRVFVPPTWPFCYENDEENLGIPPS